MRRLIRSILRTLADCLEARQAQAEADAYDLAEGYVAEDDDVFTCRYCGRKVDFLKRYHSDDRGLWHWECGSQH